MKAQNLRAFSVPATGVLILVVALLVLFSARWSCESARLSLLPRSMQQVEVDAPGLIPVKAGQDPNATPLRITAAMRPQDVSREGLGMTQYQRAHEPDAPDWPLYVWAKDPRNAQLYYDRSLRLIVETVPRYARPAGRAPVGRAFTYFGPQGVGDRPDRKLGRFRDPLVRLPWGDGERPIVYDRGLRQFFAIDLHGRLVRPGPVLPDGVAVPVDFGWPHKQPRCLSLSLDTPEPHYTYGRNPDRAVVLDAAGAIYMLDLDTLEYTRSLGALPAPASLFPSGRRARPDDLFAFEVQPVFVGKGDIYAGCAVAVLSRDATAMRLEVFDANGTSAATKDSGFWVKGVGPTSGPTVKALYANLPGAAPLTATKFVLESLHPPVLLWLSYFTTPGVEAVAGHQSLFVLPNSFAAMKGRDAESWWLPRFVGVLPFLLPGVIVGVVLARLVGGHACRAGVPVRARRLWIAATVLFGLPAYVTYQITRPNTARVTCANCGHDRWVDREKCHHCGSPWVVPELVPPAWRVIGRPEDRACNDPTPQPAETISREFEV